MEIQVKGNPTPEELAAVVALLLSSGGGAAEEPPAPSRWADREAQLRAPLRRGPGAWRSL